MTRAKAPLVALSMGDPAGVGREIILKAAAALARKRSGPALVVLGDLAALRAAARELAIDAPEPFEWSVDNDPPRRAGGLAVISVGRLPVRARVAGRPTVEGSDAAYRYIVAGCQRALAGQVDALVTAPINKEWMNRAGHHFPGHSELLAQLAGIRLWRMMFAGTHLRLALATVHIGLAQVPRQITRDNVAATIGLFAKHLEQQLGIERPRIAVLGLNPHAGEHGLFGDEEEKFIIPAIHHAQRAGIEAFGPLAPDTAFIRHNGRFAFDGAVAMYHDQGLIALKTLEFDRAVNITLGLPFVRTSPDHGTAYDIAGRGEANATSMIAAIEYAARAVRRRAAIVGGTDNRRGARLAV
jgi:4-phospho-D-threonate 3-dehydrogenase / 4-phospho-D-erythronate 3-dehydrogenase